MSRARISPTRKARQGLAIHSSQTVTGSRLRRARAAASIEATSAGRIRVKARTDIAQPGSSLVPMLM